MLHNRSRIVQTYQEAGYAEDWDAAWNLIEHHQDFSTEMLHNRSRIVQTYPEAGYAEDWDAGWKLIEHHQYKPEYIGFAGYLRRIIWYSSMLATVYFVFYIGSLYVDANYFVSNQQKYCYNVDEWPDRADPIAMIGNTPASAYATRVMPNRVHNGVRDMIQSLIDARMLGESDSLSIFVDELDYECKSIHGHEAHNIFRVKAYTESSKQCLESVFYEVLGSLNMFDDTKPINIIEMKVEQKKTDLKEVIDQLVDRSVPNSASSRANEALLSIDFVRVIGTLVNDNPDVDFYTWIEDDVLVHRGFRDLLIKALSSGYHIVASNDNYHQVPFDYGTLLVAMTQHKVKEVISRINDTMGYLPLDMQLKLEYFDEIIQCVPSCVHHNGTISTIRNSDDSWFDYYTASFPPSGGYPIGNHPISWNILKGRPNLLIKFFKWKIWETFNHVSNHGLSGGDWLSTKQTNWNNCESLVDDNNSDGKH